MLKYLYHTSLFTNAFGISGACWPSGLERWTGDRVVLISNPAAAPYSLRNVISSVYLALQTVSFGGDTKNRRSLLLGVYARGSIIYHQSAQEMCNLSWTDYRCPALNMEEEDVGSLCWRRAVCLRQFHAARLFNYLIWWVMVKGHKCG